MGDIVIDELERTIKSICRAICKEKGDCEADKLNALSKLVNSLSTQEARNSDDNGDSPYYAMLEDSYLREKNAKKNDPDDDPDDFEKEE